MHPAMREHADLIVTKGTRLPQRVLDRPWRARVHAPTYGGPWADLELDVVAVSGDLVCVEQPREGKDAWRAWIPVAAARRLPERLAPAAE